MKTILHPSDLSTATVLVKKDEYTPFASICEKLGLKWYDGDSYAKYHLFKEDSRLNEAYVCLKIGRYSISERKNPIPFSTFHLSYLLKDFSDEDREKIGDGKWFIDIKDGSNGNDVEINKLVNNTTTFWVNGHIIKGADQKYHLLYGEFPIGYIEIEIDLFRLLTASEEAEEEKPPLIGDLEQAALDFVDIEIQPDTQKEGQSAVTAYLAGYHLAESMRQQSVEPKRGDWVEVSYNGTTWCKRIYLVEIKDVCLPIICVEKGYEKYYEEGKYYSQQCWESMRPIEKPLLTTVDGVEVTDGDKIVWIISFENELFKTRAKSAVMLSPVFSTESAAQLALDLTKIRGLGLTDERILEVLKEGK